MKLEDALKSGDACTRCHVGIYRHGWNDVIALAQCHECRQLDDPDEIDHSRLLRCPKCRDTWKAEGDAEGGVYIEGEHTVKCPECGWLFGIITEVSHNFTSPALDEQEKSP